MATNTSPKKSSGYGKRPIWQWVVIYLIIGAIGYALLYYLFVHKSGTVSPY